MLCMPRFLQQVTGEAPASILVNIYLPISKTEPRATGPSPKGTRAGLSAGKWHFLHQRQQLLPPSLPTSG